MDETTRLIIQKIRLRIENQGSLSPHEWNTIIGNLRLNKQDGLEIAKILERNGFVTINQNKVVKIKRL